MTGVAKTLDKNEEKMRVWNRKIADKTNISSSGRAMAGDPLATMGEFGELKRKYGQSHDIDTSEGYYAGKQEHEQQQAEKKATDEAAALAEKERADAAARDQAATEANQESQRKALKRKGRRASILTDTGSDNLNQLGNVSRPNASGL